MREAVEPNVRCAPGGDLLVLDAPSAALALRAILFLRPRFVLVRVSSEQGEHMTLLRLLRDVGTPLIRIVAVDRHDDGLERAVRAAGATCYLSGSECEAVVDTMSLAELRV